jgi:hypothetical protein
MLENSDAVERHIYRTYWNDGLLDLFAATGVLIIGVLWLRDWVAVGATVPVWLAALWHPARRRIIEPRLGTVEFAEDRQRRSGRLLKAVFYFGVGVLILALCVFFYRDRLPSSPSTSLIAALPAFLLALLAIAASFLISSARFIAYAAILVGAGLLGALGAWPPGAILTAAGAAILVIAITLFAGFLRRNPLDEENA